MDEKLLRVIDLVAQLREAMREVDAVLFCDVSRVYTEDGPGVVDGYKSEVFTAENIGFSEIEEFKSNKKLNSCYTVVDGVKVSCLEEKEEA